MVQSLGKKIWQFLKQHYHMSQEFHSKILKILVQAKTCIWIFMAALW
jgi:hypothetical protein